MKPTFSIVMPCYLGAYKGAAANRDAKLLRAVDSVIRQTYPSWELIIVADGCHRTMELIGEHYSNEKRITALLIEKQELWAPGVRNAGLRNAKGKWCAYLDSDDYFGTTHLERLAVSLKSVDGCWVWFNDLVWDTRHKAFVERICDISHKDKHGTSNLVHRTGTAFWKDGTYKQDALFANELKKTCEGVKIPTAEYCVAHIPGKYDL